MFFNSVNKSMLVDQQFLVPTSAVQRFVSILLLLATVAVAAIVTTVVVTTVVVVIVFVVIVCRRY